MPSSRSATVSFLLLLLSAPALAVASEEVPYGHVDFHPSSERPAQLRGDGSGHFPAATPVTHWDFIHGQNIVWAAPLPGWGNSSPIVVGDKAFVTCDLNKLVCIDVGSGEVLWVRENHTGEVLGQKAASVHERFRADVQTWYDAVACCWEISYIDWRLDVIDAALSGKRFVFPRNGYPAYQGSKNKYNIPGDHLSSAELEQIVAAAKPGGAEERQALLARKKQLVDLRKRKQWGPNFSGYVAPLCPIVRGKGHEDWEKGRRDLVKSYVEHGLLTDSWNGWLGSSFPTPVSDGERVYVQFGQMQVACYDLDGNRQWLQVFPEHAVHWKITQHNAASPVLADDTLIVVHGGSDKGNRKWPAFAGIRAIDTRTGRSLWTRRLPMRASGHPFVQHMRLKHGDTDVIVVGSSAVVRTSDGKVLLDGMPTTVAPPVVHGNAAFLQGGGGQCAGDGARIKIVVEGDDARIAWGFVPAKSRVGFFDKLAQVHDTVRQVGGRSAGPASSTGGLVYRGRYLVGGRPYHQYDIETGADCSDPEQIKALEKARKTKLSGRGHLLRAGPVLIDPAGWNGNSAVWRLDGDLDRIAVNRLGSEIHRRIQLGTISREEAVALIREQHWLPCMDRRWGVMQSTPWAQGGRLYLRTKDTLYCVGRK